MTSDNEENINSPEYYCERFLQVMRENIPIVDGNEKGKYFVPEDGEEFVQVYQKDKPETHLYPKFWFASNKGNVISVSRKKPKRLKKNKDNGEYYSYGISIEGNGKVTYKKAYLHVLVGILFDSYRYGDCDQKLKEKGIYATGLIYDEGVVNYHHTYNASNNNPLAGEFLPSEIHLKLTEFNKKEPTFTETCDLLRDVSVHDENEKEYYLYMDTPKGLLRSGQLSEEAGQTINEWVKKAIWIPITVIDSDEQ